MAAISGRMRIREVLPELYLGRFPAGPNNSLTDIPGILVSTQTITSSKKHPQKTVNTGVTAILPRKDWYYNHSYAGFFTFNGSGELTASHWLSETGLLDSPIILTNSIAIGAAYDGVWQHAMREYGDEDGECDLYPVVAETWDGYLNDLSAFAVQPEDVDTAISNASSAPVQEGNTGGGTGMICNRFKGGTGSASRIIPSESAAGNAEAEGAYTIACLAQCNYGLKRDFHVGGKAIGRWMLEKEEAAQVASTSEETKRDGSIIIILSTSAPLHPLQLQRLARRATVGLARVGGSGTGRHGSGDIFLAFSTGNAIPRCEDGTLPQLGPEMKFLHDETLNDLFEAAADVVEEGIYNAVCMAESMTGWKGRVVEAVDLEMLRRAYRSE